MKQPRFSVTLAALLATLLYPLLGRANEPPGSQPTSAPTSTKGSKPAPPPPFNAATSNRVQMPEQTVRGRGRPKIVIVGMGARFAAASWPQVEERTGAELSNLGFEVLRVPGQVAGTDAQMAELGTQAVEQGAIAAIRIVRTAGKRAVQVWIYDALTRKMVLRKTPLSRSAITGDTAALQIVELLHASMLEVRIARKKALGRKVPQLVERLVARKLQAKSASKPPPRELSSRYRLSASGAVSLLGDGLGPTFGLAIAFSYRLIRAIRLGAELSVPLSTTSVDDPHGTTSVIGGSGRFLALVEAYAESRFSPAFGIAFGALVLRASGRPLRGLATLSSGASCRWPARAFS
jgi:hypothetical protein